MTPERSNIRFYGFIAGCPVVAVVLVAPLRCCSAGCSLRGSYLQHRSSSSIYLRAQVAAN